MKKRLIFTLTILTTTCWITASQFYDIVWNKYETDISDLANRGVVKWYPDGTFKPDQWITRAEMLKIALLASNTEIQEREEWCFPDVSTWERFHNIICTAKDIWIIKWYPDWTFKPNKNVSIVEWLKIWMESFKINTREIKSNFRYERYLNFADENQIFSKYSLYPEWELTRGMMSHLAVSLIKWQAENWNQESGYPSQWCNKKQPSIAPSSIMIDGIERHFITKIWNRYSHSKIKPAKLIFAFHGRTQPYDSLWYYNIERKWDWNSIIIYPAWLPEEWPQRSRMNPWDKVTALRDYKLFDEILKEISENYCIDLSQVYVVWHSLWWRFTSMLWCARWAQIHGIWIVGWSPMTFPTCSAPISAIIFHNPNDPLAWYAWWEEIRNKIVKQNQCSNETETYKNSYDMDCVKYKNCLPWANVVFCKYYEWWHNRPNWAAEMMYEFWKKE